MLVHVTVAAAESNLSTEYDDERYHREYLDGNGPVVDALATGCAAA
jgi:hypothetical protein